MLDGASDIRLWMATEWADHFARALEAMAEEKPSIVLEPTAPTSEAASAGGSETVLWWRQEFDTAPGVHCWVGAAAQSWSAIGAKVLKAAGVENEDTESARGTYLEILHQSLSALGQSLSSRLEREIVRGEGSESAPDITPADGHLARFTLGAVECQISIVFPDTFLAAMKSTSERQTPTLAPAAPVAPTLPDRSPSMDLLLDVELPVSVSFGRAELPLKDVLKLTTGSIIELNRSVSEPVEIIVNNCVIARGEVVVVEGNFGVRIRQVISRQERMRTLK